MPAAYKGVFKKSRPEICLPQFSLHSTNDCHGVSDHEYHNATAFPLSPLPSPLSPLSLPLPLPLPLPLARPRPPQLQEQFFLFR